MKWLASGALLATVIAACAASAPKPMATAAPEAGAPPMAPVSADTPEHQQIQQLADQIDHQRSTLRLPEQHGAPMGVEPHVTNVCKRDPSETCVQTCQLSDSICDNTKKICDIAQTLQGDDWAAKKCGDANATCSAATKQCCECASS
ncbi:MAG: hypothetical protein QM831_08840 [Kofleriaceae bacterium]